MRDRRGRGRLAAIDMLPDWAEQAKLWAFAELKRNKRTQLEICEEFNARLRAAADREGIADPPQISKSALNRRALRLAVLGRRIEETREIAAVLAPRLDEAGDSSVAIMVAETIKTLIAEMLGNAGELKPDGDTAEMLMMTARALQSAEGAKRISGDTRRKIEAELSSKTAKAVDTVAKAKGLTKDTVDAIKAQILGLDA